MKTLLRRALVAALVSLSAVTAAFALQVDQTRNMVARQYNDYHPVYHRLTINYNDTNIGSGQMFGALNAGDFIQSIDCDVTTAFNAGTTNAVTIGTSAAANEIVATGLNGTTSIATGIYHLTTAAGLGLAVTGSSSVTLWAKYAQTGTAATAGSVTCVIETIPNNDN